jgi:hypothetical protein
VKLSNGVAGLRIGRCRDRAGVHDNDVGGRSLPCGRVAAVKQLALKRGAIGLRSAAAELFDVESCHFKPARLAEKQSGRAAPRIAALEGYEKAKGKSNSQ